MFKRNNLKYFIIAVTIWLFVCSILHAQGQDELNEKAVLAKNVLIKRFNNKGTWWTFFNFDTIPDDFKRLTDFYIGMLIADFLEPYRTDPKIDSIVRRTLDFSYENINPENGFLKFYNRIDGLPEDSDDTGLFWYLAENVDTRFVKIIIDSLQKYKTKDGLYLEWLRKGGIKHLRQTGTNPETVEIIPNIHVYLFLSKYDTLLASELCQSLQAENVVSNPEFWVYYYRAPWLYYIRQIDMANQGCELHANLPKEVKSLASQDIYEELSRLIRDFSLGRKYAGRNMQAREVLLILSQNNFEYFRNNPILIFHNDLTSKAHAHYWSYDVPYALWLRLYYVYNNQSKKR